MQIQIKSLQVKNCGPLDDVIIDFTSNGQPRPITVIRGNNGSGKTTVLELMVALAESVMGNPHKKLGSSTMKPELRLTQSDYSQLNLRVDNQDYSIVYNRQQAELPTSQDIIHSKIQQLSFAQSETPIEPGEWGALKLPSIFYFPSYRQFSPAIGQQINQEDMFYQWVYRYEMLDKFQGSLNSYFVWLDHADPDYFAEIKAFINTTVLVNKAIDKVDRSKLAVTVKLSNGQTHYLNELSSGEQNLLVIMLELRRRLIPGSVVLIDEIENSLHLAFQYQMGVALLKLQEQIPFQLIVTTHAPAFVDIFGAENTLLLTMF